MALRARIELTLPKPLNSNMQKMSSFVNDASAKRKTREGEVCLTWCTVHIGDGLFVTALLHVAPAAKVGKLNMT